MSFSISVTALSGRIETIDGVTDETRLIEVYRKVAERMGKDVKTVRLCIHGEMFVEQDLSEALCDLDVGEGANLDVILQEPPFAATISFEGIHCLAAEAKVGPIVRANTKTSCVTSFHDGELLIQRGDHISVVFSLKGLSVASRCFTLRVRHGIVPDEDSRDDLFGDTCIRIKLNQHILCDNEFVVKMHPFITRLELPLEALDADENIIQLDFVQGTDRYCVSQLSVEDSFS